MDTRPAFAVGPKTSPLGPAEIYTVDALGTNGNCNLPNDASGLALNVTATDATLITFLTIWGDGSQPIASSLNPSPGQPPTPNAVTTDLTNAGKFKIFNKQGNVNVLIDVIGYYANHDHDDRYYTKANVDASRFVTQTFSPFNIEFTGSSNTYTLNGCPTAPTGSTSGRLGLDLPVGAKLNTATASIFDDASTNGYSVTL